MKGGSSLSPNIRSLINTGTYGMLHLPIVGIWKVKLENVISFVVVKMAGILDGGEVNPIPRKSKGPNFAPW